MVEETKAPKVGTPTHGMRLTTVCKDGVKRAVSLYKFEDGALGWFFETWWDGEDKPPLETRLYLSDAGLELLFASLYKLNELDNWPIQN